MAALPGGFRPMTIAGAVRAAAGRGPGRVALRMGEVTRSYAELVARIDRVRDAVITDLALVPGQHAAIIAGNCMAYIEIVCGVPEAGVAVATIGSKLSRTEMISALDDAQACVLFADDASADRLAGADFATVRRVIRLGAEYEAWLLGASVPGVLPVVQEWDVWTIPYTSGTTGKPKGVLLPHRARVMVGFLSQTEFGCFGADDVFLAISPMNHGAGLGFPLAALQGGGVLEIVEKFDPAAVLRRFKHGGITGTFLVPTHFHGFFGLSEPILDECARPGLRAIIANAAPLSMAMKRRIVPYFGDDVLYEIYGATESGLVTSLKPAHQLSHDACVGLPFAHTRVRLLNEAGEDCAPGQIGEVFSTSPVLFNGYWNRPEETERAFRGEWLSVGDMGRMDADGFLYLMDRKGDMVISGGTNIYPREVEEVLAAHPAVAEIAVTGIPDEKWGESLKAFAVLKPGCVLTQSELVEFCRERIAGFKIPKALEILAALPRNANGKILKRELRRQ
jgi:acyl-CoA synthetase (AMP-forming)/AMP-acid ligase II